MGGQEVNRTLSPTGALHEKNSLAIGDKGGYGFALVLPKLGIRSTRQGSQRRENWIIHVRNTTGRVHLPGALMEPMYPSPGVVAGQHR
jgi:hypothetical protein